MKQYRSLIKPYLVWAFVVIVIPLILIALYAFTEDGNEVLTFSFTEAAYDLGANKFQTFTKVIWKLSIPGVLNGIMMVFLLSISTFVIPKLLGGGQYMLIGNLIESQFISVGDWNFGSAISLILAVLILIFMSLMKKMDKDE